MRNSKKLATGARFAISLGLALLLIGLFLGFGGPFGVVNVNAAPYADKTDNNANTENNGQGSAGADNPNNPHFVPPDPIGGNAGVTRFATNTSVIEGVAVTTRIQNGRPTRVCVEHVANGKTNVINFDPFKNENANDVDHDIIDGSPKGSPRVEGNEQWQLCGPGAITPSSSSSTTSSSTTQAPVVSGVAVTAGPAATTTTTAPAPVVTPPVVTTPTIIAAVLPQAGGLPLLPGALAGLGSLLFAGGVLLRRFVR